MREVLSESRMGYVVSVNMWCPAVSAF